MTCRPLASVNSLTRLAAGLACKVSRDCANIVRISARGRRRRRRRPDLGMVRLFLTTPDLERWDAPIQGLGRVGRPRMCRPMLLVLRPAESNDNSLMFKPWRCLRVARRRFPHPGRPEPFLRYARHSLLKLVTAPTRAEQGP